MDVFETLLKDVLLTIFPSKYQLVVNIGFFAQQFHMRLPYKMIR
jgi:hypothetical protein